MSTTTRLAVGRAGPDLRRWCEVAAWSLLEVLADLGVLLPEPETEAPRLALVTTADLTIVIGCELPLAPAAAAAGELPVSVVTLAFEFEAQCAQSLGGAVAYALTRMRLPPAGARRDEWLEGALSELVNRAVCRAVAAIDAALQVTSPTVLRGPGEALSETSQPMPTASIDSDRGRVVVGAFRGQSRKTQSFAPIEPTARRVLIADDSPVVRMAFRMEFEDTEFEVVGEARHGREVVELFRKLRPDLLVLDVNMPILSGLDAVKIIHADEAQVHVVICSAASNAALNLSPGTVFVPKPFAPGALLAAARALPSAAQRVSDGPEEPESEPSPLPHSTTPRTLAGYRVGPLLAEGGMGLVYMGRDPGLGREVAIKVLKSEVARNVDWVVSFLEEARAVARLNHPNVVQIYFAGSDQGRHFFVMEHLPGPNLDELVVRHGPMDVEAALAVIRAAAAGLGAAHERGLFHCDVKPSNLVFSNEGVVKVTDFGIAVSEGRERLGIVAGTPSFMAPEQVQGGAIDARSDIYSLGATLYFLVTGDNPYEASDERETAFRHLSQPVPQVPAGPAALNRLLRTMMAKSPLDRPVDAAALRELLRACSAELARG